MKKIKLYCLPYAGGSAMVYTRLKKFLKSSVELCPLELAGRGKRMNEKYSESIREMVDDLYDKIKDEIETGAYAFFGHSMGALLVYELYCKLRSMFYEEPMHVFLSGRYPPHIRKVEKELHRLPEPEFEEAISRIGGTPREVFDNEELRNIFFPLLRADYKVLETYTFVSRNFKFNCGVTIFYGNEDADVERDELDEWENYTLQNMHIVEFKGGHFFINDKMQEIASLINQKL